MFGGFVTSIRMFGAPKELKEIAKIANDLVKEAERFVTSEDINKRLAKIKDLVDRLYNQAVALRQSISPETLPPKLVSILDSIVKECHEAKRAMENLSQAIETAKKEVSDIIEVAKELSQLTKRMKKVASLAKKLEKELEELTVEKLKA